MTLHNAPLDHGSTGGPIARVEQIALTPEQAAIVIGRSRTRVFKAIKDKELTARKDGKATLLEATELRRWVQSLPTIGRSPLADVAA